MTVRRTIAVLACSLCAATTMLCTGTPALAQGDANTPACPATTEASPGFRSYLPDCRAYEMVTPPYEGGYEPLTLEGISEDGSRIIMSSFGTYAGSVGTSSVDNSNVYEVNRSESGWVSTSLSPPTSEFAYAREFGPSRDLNTTLWQLRTASQSVYDADLYLRSRDGAFTKVGPLLPGSVTEGPSGGHFYSTPPGLRAPSLSWSGDLSHIVVSYDVESQTMRLGLWPGDETEKGFSSESLYEYEGTGNSEPLLVGVRNNGRLRGQPYVNDGAELISRCGTLLGSGQNDTYNAISESGVRVFFTPYAKDQENCGAPEPAVMELYVREGSERTIPLSARSATECSGSCATSSPRDASFAGASADGNRVYFTSTQQLLNTAAEDEDSEDSAFGGCANTEGAGGCNLYEYDFSAPPGQQLSLVSSGGAGGAEVQGVMRVSRDGSHVYFVAKGKLTGANAEGLEPVAGAENMYLYEQTSSSPGRLVFVATLSGEDKGQDWRRLDAHYVEVTPDGAFVVFPSHAQLTSGDKSGEGTLQLFEYDAESERLHRVSIGYHNPAFTASYYCPVTEAFEAGYGCDGNIQEESENPLSSNPDTPSYFEAFQPATELNSLVLAADGSMVFESAAALTPQAVDNGCSHVYEYERESGGGEAGNVYLLSDGDDTTQHQGTCGSWKAQISSGGGDVFFETGDSLVPQDTDTQRNLYDVRVDGGQAALVAPEGCEGDACQGAGSGAPALPIAGSGAPAGGNSVPSSLPKASTKSKARRRPGSAAIKRKLAGALAVCRRESRSRRHACEARARRRYRDGVTKASGRSGR